MTRLRPSGGVAVRSLLMAAVLLGAPGWSYGGEPDAAALRAVATNVVVNVVQPASRAFAERAKRLAAETATACRNGGGPPEPLRTAFREAATAWGRLAVARFGPLAAESRLEKLAFWPDARGVIARQTRLLAPALPAGDAEAAAWIAGQSAAVQGLPALDLLAFADDASMQCRMAMAVAGNIERLAAEVAAGFAETRHLALLSPGPDNAAYHDERESIGELLRALSTQVQILGTVMILPALGERPEDAKASRLFLRFDPATKPFLAGAVDGVEQFLNAMALESIVADEGRSALQSAGRELRTAKEMIAGLPTEPTTMVADPQSRGRLVTAALALEGFGRVVDRQLAPALGLKVGFNALDGD